MARIKAKPMNRISTAISPGTVAGMPGIKAVNGFRTPPIQSQPINPYIDQGPGVTQAGPPAPPPQHPQAARLFYTNGGPAQYAPVNYATNLQVYVCIFGYSTFNNFMTIKYFSIIRMYKYSLFRIYSYVKYC